MSARRLVLCLAALAAAAPAAMHAQDFGQNKITYEHFQWSVYRSPHFDVHYYKEEAPLLEEVVAEAESAYLDLSRRLDHEVRLRIPLILYRTHAEFEQTNISLEEIPEAVGAFAEPFQNRMVVPIDSPPDKRFTLIRHELTHIFEFDIFYAGLLRRAVRAEPPLWLVEGLASYLGDDEDSFDQMVIRDAVVNNMIPSIKQLNVFSFMTYRYGHAIFDFIESTYGTQGLRTFLFEFRKVLMTPAPEKAFQDAFGLSVDAFDRRFARFLRQRYLPVLTEKRAPEDYGKEIGLQERGRFTFSPTLSPSGELIAVLGTPGLKLDVLILSAKDGKLIHNLTRGFTNSYEDVVTEAFAGKRDLTWSPDGDLLAFFVRKENYRQLMIYNVPARRLERKLRFAGIADLASPAFSPDGQSIAFSGNKDGVWDIFRYDMRSGAIENLTQDEYYDSNPSWSPDGQQVLYNRRIGAFEKVFLVAVGAPERKVELTAGASSDIEPAYSRDGKWIYFSSDRGLYGVFNLHRLELASGRTERLTDAVGGAFTPAEMAPAENGVPQIVFAAFQGQAFRLYKMKIAGAEVERAIKVGKEEPPTSPLAPSRRAEYEAAKKARLQAEPPPPTEGATPPAVAPPAGATPEAPPSPPPPAPGAPAAPAAGTASADADLRPFRAPLQLGLDSARVSPYKRKWNLEAPSVMVGVTNDGSLLSDVALNFADLLGDQRFSVRAASVSSFSNVTATYMNLARRLDWGVQLIDYRDYYLSSDVAAATPSQRYQRRQRFTAVEALASYPFSRFSRVEGAIGYAQRRYSYPTLTPVDPNNPYSDLVLDFTDYGDDFPIASLAFVNDTTRYQEWGPFQGRRLRIEVSGLHFTSGDSKGDSVKSMDLDFRAYQHLTHRSLLAFHLAGVVQDGERASIYPLGGINQLRGYDYREFIGTNVVWANVEFRFPLIDELRWGFGLRMGPMRGFVFADAGTAWFNNALHYDCKQVQPGVLLADCQLATGKAVYDADFNVLRNFIGKGDDGRWVDVHASAGLGFEVPVFGLPFTWSFAKKYDGKEFGPYTSSFYIVFDW